MKHSLVLIALASLLVFGCNKNPDTIPVPGNTTVQSGESSPHGDAGGGTLQGQKAHEGLPTANADGIQPTVEDGGITLVGWDELVKHGDKYVGKTVHVKAIMGGAVKDSTKKIFGYLFPVDMDAELMAQLMEFTRQQPEVGKSLPLRCESDNAGDMLHIKAGANVVMEGVVTVDRTGPGSGFTQQRGITEAKYVTLMHARVVR